MSNFIAPAPENHALVPVPIRADTVAYLRFPKDITKAEAEKIARVIVAYATDTSPGNMENERDAGR